MSAFDDEHDCASVEEAAAYSSQRVAELESQCAAMRNCLETLNRLGGLGYDKHRWIDEALAPDAGKGLHARLARLELATFALPKLDIERAVTAMRERAARIAEGCLDLERPEAIPASIRALKDGP